MRYCSDNKGQALQGVTNETVDPMSMHELRGTDLEHFVRGAALPRWQTEPMASRLSARLRATATGRTCQGARHPSPTAVASIDGQNPRPAKFFQPLHRLPAEAFRRSGPVLQRLATPSPSALPLRGLLRSAAVAAQAPIVRSDPRETDMSTAVLASDTNRGPTDDTETEQANDWR